MKVTAKHAGHAADDMTFEVKVQLTARDVRALADGILGEYLPSKMLDEQAGDDDEIGFADLVGRPKNRAMVRKVLAEMLRDTLRGQLAEDIGDGAYAGR